MPPKEAGLVALGKAMRDGITAIPAAWQLGLLIPGATAVAVAGALIPAIRAARLPAAEALRNE